MMKLWKFSSVSGFFFSVFVLDFRLGIPGGRK